MRQEVLTEIPERGQRSPGKRVWPHHYESGVPGTDDGRGIEPGQDPACQPRMIPRGPLQLALAFPPGIGRARRVPVDSLGKCRHDSLGKVDAVDSCWNTTICWVR